MANINPSSSNGPSNAEPSRTNLPFFQRISTYIFGAAGIIVALTYFFNQLPPAIKSVKDLSGMLKPDHGQPAGMLNPDNDQSGHIFNNNTNNNINYTVEERSKKPNENCTDVLSVDNSVLPPTSHHTWNCPKATEKIK
jgi:hypothetical protein